MATKAKRYQPQMNADKNFELRLDLKVLICVYPRSSAANFYLMMCARRSMTLEF
jgi:hypothetical protein